MTQEFEAVSQSNEWGRLSIEKRYDGRYSSSHTALAYTFWQASREQLKAKLLSDEMVEVVAKGICESWYISAGNRVKGKWSAFSEGGKDNFRRDAKAALESVVGEL